jgi:hypothetical protein
VGQEDSDEESADGKEGEFQPSDDEELVVTGTVKKRSLTNHQNRKR